MESRVIRQYGILNEQIRPGDMILHGIPYPGSYVINEQGIVVAKFFHDSYKKRDSPEALIDAALGRISLAPESPQSTAETPEVRVTAAIRGGQASIRQGIIRHLVVRFELSEGLHLYGPPVPTGMVPVDISIRPQPGLEILEATVPPSHPLRLKEPPIELNVWDGTVDFVIPFFPTGVIASEVRPLDQPSLRLEVTVRYQACNEDTCLLPRTESFLFELPLDVIDVPNISLHTGHGQREGSYDGSRHLKRLLIRKIRRNPLGFLRYIGTHIRLETAALIRRIRAG